MFVYFSHLYNVPGALSYLLHHKKRTTVSTKSQRFLQRCLHRFLQFLYSFYHRCRNRCRTSWEFQQKPLTSILILLTLLLQPEDWSQHSVKALNCLAEILVNLAQQQRESVRQLIFKGSYSSYNGFYNLRYHKASQACVCAHIVACASRKDPLQSLSV